MALTPNVASGATITSAWGNEIRDRTVQVFASAAARTAAWAAPPEGAQSYLQDVNRQEFYDGATWRAAAFGGTAGQNVVLGSPTAVAPGPIAVFTTHNVVSTDAGGFINVAVPAGTFTQIWHVHGSDIGLSAGATVELTVSFEQPTSSLTSLRFRVWRHDSNGVWASASLRLGVFAIGAP